MTDYSSHNPVLYALYANSFGSDKIYFPNNLDDPQKKYSILSEIIDGIYGELNRGNVHFISEEFRAKALSVFLQYSGKPDKYADALKQLKDLPVARTANELEVLKKERDAAIEGNPNLFNQGKGHKKYISIGHIKTDAMKNKFVDRADYVEKALQLVTLENTAKREKGLRTAKKIEAHYATDSINSQEFKDDTTELTAEFTSEGLEYPEALKEYITGRGEESVPVATTATDTPSVPDAQVVEESSAAESSSGEEPGPPMIVADAIAKATSTSNKIQRAVQTKKVESIIIDNTALYDNDQILKIDGDRAEKLDRVWAVVREILTDEIRVSSVFKEKVRKYYNGLNTGGQNANKKTFNAFMELEPDDDYYDAFAINARAKFYEGHVDPQAQLDETLDESMIGEEIPEEEANAEQVSEQDEPPVFDEAPEEELPVIQAQQTDEERRREIEAANRDLIDELTTEQQARLFAAPVRVLENWVAARRYAIEAQVQGNVDHDEADNGADDGFFGLRNNYINAILLSQQYDFQDFIRVRDLLRGQPEAVYTAALERIRARPNQAIAFDQQFLNEVLQQQNDAGNIVEGAAPQPAGAPAADVDNEAYAGLGALFYEYPRPPDPEPLVENKPQASGAQPITGTGADSEKLIYRARVHPDVIEIFFGQASFPAWDPDLEKKLMSMELSEARRVEIMDDVIAEYGKKIFIKQRKGSSKEELNELVQLQFCVMRNLQRGPRASTASIKVADLVRMQALAAGSGAPNVPATNPPPAQGPLGPEAQQVANIQAAGLAPQGTGVPPKPMITEARGEITNAQVQSFSEAKFISDYSKMQMAKNLNSGVPLQYPNPVPKVFNNQTPQTVNHPGRSAGLGRRRVGEFSAGKF